MTRTLTALLMTSAALALGACGDDDGEDAATTAGATTATAEAAAPAPAPGEGCRGVAAPEPKGEQSLDAPAERLDPEKVWTVSLLTNCGTIEIRLDVKENPKTASSFAHLVEEGFYDGLTFHRIVEGFVIQGGDPLGSGQGGPGYSVVERPPSATQYSKGVVAMAKTQIEDPGTSGSQFFVVTGEDAGLPPDYAVAGRVTGGMEVAERIAQIEVDPATDMPAAPVVIEKATLESSAR